MKRVAVIGGGIFGCTAALFAARAGHDVELFEQMPGLMRAASWINQYRLHRGYHYPRSSDTAVETQASDATFRAEFGEAVLDDGRPLYAIARRQSKVTASQFLAFCDLHKLQHRVVDAPELINPDLVELVIEGVEARFDPDILRSLVESKIAQSGVKVRLGVRAGREVADDFDKVIVAGYANTNTILAEFGGSSQPYQFEVCEKPVVTLPASFGATSIVIMDGPFMSVDPLGRSGRYVLGNVVHAIHAENMGFAPVVPDHLLRYLNQGIVEPRHTKFSSFIESGSQFIPLLRQARHVGSMYTIRTVLAGRDYDDARLTEVKPIGDQLIKIFSGKVGTCVDSARKAVALI